MVILIIWLRVVVVVVVVVCSWKRRTGSVFTLYKSKGVADASKFSFRTTPNIWWSYCCNSCAIDDPGPDHTYFRVTFCDDLTKAKVAAIIQAIEADEEVKEIRRKFDYNCNREIRITFYLYDDYPKSN